MKCKYEEIITEHGDKATSFNIHTKKGFCCGLYSDKIYIHLIEGEGSVKGLMNILVNKFKTNKITITPLINNNVKNSIKGEISVMKADDKRNPYGEDFEYMDLEWVCV